MRDMFKGTPCLEIITNTYLSRCSAQNMHEEGRKKIKATWNSNCQKHFLPSTDIHPVDKHILLCTASFPREETQIYRQNNRNIKFIQFSPCKYNIISSSRKVFCNKVGWNTTWQTRPPWVSAVETLREKKWSLGKGRQERSITVNEEVKVRGKNLHAVSLQSSSKLRIHSHNTHPRLGAAQHTPIIRRRRQAILPRSSDGFCRQNYISWRQGSRLTTWNPSLFFDMWSLIIVFLPPTVLVSDFVCLYFSFVFFLILIGLCHVHCPT